MLPTHYAITEILIVISSIYSIRQLSLKKNYFAIIGIAMIGIAAAVGAIRFGLLDTEFMIQLNKKLGLYAGIICLSFISVQMAFNLDWKKIAWMLLFTALVCLLISIIWPKYFLINLIFFWSFVSILIALDFPEKKFTYRIFRGAMMSILVISFLTVSKNGFLVDIIGPMTSFHLYHFLIALWVYLINFIIKKTKV